MNREVEKGMGVVYHEMGHFIGYYLSNQSSETSLGQVDKIELGLLNNCTFAKIKHFHVENILVESKRILEDTSNIERTVAWFVEVISGCTFQILFEKKEFNNCFGVDPNKIGSVDFNNLSVIRNVSFFNWSFNDIHEIQKDYQKIIEKDMLILKVKPIVDKYLKEIDKNQDHQIQIKDSQLRELYSNIDGLINKKIIDSYLKIIEKYKLKFKKKLSTTKN